MTKMKYPGKQDQLLYHENLLPQLYAQHIFDVVSLGIKFMW